MATTDDPIEIPEHIRRFHADLQGVMGAVLNPPPALSRKRINWRAPLVIPVGDFFVLLVLAGVLGVVIGSLLVLEGVI